MNYAQFSVHIKSVRLSKHVKNKELNWNILLMYRFLSILDLSGITTKFHTTTLFSLLTYKQKSLPHSHCCSNLKSHAIFHIEFIDMFMIHLQQLITYCHQIKNTKFRFHATAMLSYILTPWFKIFICYRMYFKTLY